MALIESFIGNFKYAGHSAKPFINYNTSDDGNDNTDGLKPPPEGLKKLATLAPQGDGCPAPRV